MSRQQPSTGYTPDINRPIVEEAIAYTSELLQTELPDYFLYHNYDHTMKVVQACRDLADDMNLNDTDRELLIVAACFHDVGFIHTIQDHEDKSKEMAAKFLEARNYPKDRIKIVEQLIDATHPDVEPKTTLQSLIKDADLHSLGSNEYDEISESLRKEWSLTLGLHYNDLEWLEENTRFLKEHRYYSQAAKDRYGPGKDQNLESALSELKKTEKKWRKQVKKQILSQSDITSSKSAQMMFKTSLRNHIDLTNIADNKANIMLSINALLITISMPILGAYIQNNILILIPSGILLLTSVLSIIFATLATRPIRMYGYTPLEKIKKETTNLFFFGNFYNMKLEEYQEGMTHVLSDVEKLDKTIMTDLYYLGKALGKKYYQLRICYSIFMVGITLSVIAFAITFMIQPISIF